MVEAGRVIPSVSVEQLPFAHRLKWDKANRKQQLLDLPPFPFPGVCDFGLDPLTVHAVLREDEQQLIVQANRLINLLVDFAASLHFLRRKPAAYAPGLQVCMKPLGKLLVSLSWATRCATVASPDPDR